MVVIMIPNKTYNSNISGISINVDCNLFPIKIWKFLAISIGWGYYEWLKIIKDDSDVSRVFLGIPLPTQQIFLERL